MFIHKGIRQQLAKERSRNNDLSEKMQQREADIDYIAMMTDVELETDTEEVTDDE